MKVTKEHIGEIIRFGMVGALATLTQYGIYFVMVHFAINANISYAVGYVISFLGNMWLTSIFTFKRKLNTKRGLGFAGSHAFNFFFQLGLLNAFLYLGLPEKLAPLPVYAIAIPINFLLVRFVFKKN